VILYGRNPVREALKGRRAKTLEQLWATTGAAKEPWLKEQRVSVHSSDEIEERCGSSAHQGVCATVGPFPYFGAEELLGRGEDPLIVVLDQVQDPQNLGSICRTAECTGATGVVIPERRAVDVTPAVCKASAGAVEHLPLARVRNLSDFMRLARDKGFWCYGASAEDGSERRAVPYDRPDYSGSGVVLVLGSEGRGLRPLVARECDELIALPLLGKIESLGVSAAASALLYEILQKRAGRVDKGS
jgi:23S rRNA (guanosine2251-2'-O)-methyltransferase